MPQRPEREQWRCLLCPERADRAHVRSRGAGGPDSPENIVPLCRRHHVEQHTRGWPEFASRHFQVEAALNDRGWVLQEVCGNRRLVRR